MYSSDLDGVSEPEDHVASELEMMAGLIDGAFGAPRSIPEQAAFFARHLQPWVSVFAKDLQRAEASAFYGSVGAVLETFIDIEIGAFALES